MRFIIKELVTFGVTWVLQTVVPLHGVLQEGFQPSHGVDVSTCERACRLSATSKLWACPSGEVRGHKLSELPGHPGLRWGQ